MPTTKYVLFYKPDAAKSAEAGPLFPAHLQHFTAAAERGDLLSFGAFADLLTDGSMGIFPTREAAEAFVESDPFVTGGIVATHEIKEWTDSVA